jgi:hypothetical protein
MPQPYPLPSTPPLPTSPPLPGLPTPGPQPSAPPLQQQPLTPSQTAGVESPQQCETPQQTRERREQQRASCKKLVRIKVKAHFRKVCVSEAIEHEAKRYRKKLVRKYITKPAGKLGRDATDWFLKELGLTPYAEQAKDVKKRVSDLTKKRKVRRIEVPGTHVDFDPAEILSTIAKEYGKKP